ncbi:MAG: hypothetical protein SOR45_01885 [Collinsella bouchesdurhonensis]|nr:hypothetical protein [Collinsella bouchesdurhonensis]
MSAAQSLVIEILAKLFVEGLVKIISAWNKVIEKGGTTVVGGIFVVGKRIYAFNLIRKVAEQLIGVNRRIDAEVLDIVSIGVFKLLREIVADALAYILVVL